MTDLRYPIGRFEDRPPRNAAERRELIVQLAEVPARLRAAVSGLSADQLDTEYRPGGWTLRQVVHHLADAQMNWYIRTKFALTQNEPRIKPYDEGRWAEQPDARSQPIEPSLILLDGLHRRWVELFRSLSESQWMRSMVHPYSLSFQLVATLPMHVWHGRHHTAHILELRKRLGWK